MPKLNVSKSNYCVQISSESKRPLRRGLEEESRFAERLPVTCKGLDGALSEMLQDVAEEPAANDLGYTRL